jgi:hypothetical protein
MAEYPKYWFKPKGSKSARIAEEEEYLAACIKEQEEIHKRLKEEYESDMNHD